MQYVTSHRYFFGVHTSLSRTINATYPVHDGCWIGKRVRVTMVHCYYIDTGVLKYTTRKIHTKPHPGPEWRIFHILTSEDIDDVISRFFTAVCVWVVVCLENKKNSTR